MLDTGCLMHVNIRKAFVIKYLQLILAWLSSSIVRNSAAPIRGPPPTIFIILQYADFSSKILSGYFIQLLRYAAPPDARSTIVHLRSVETASLVLE